MTDPLNSLPEERLDNYLDGFMEDAERGAFENSLHEDPQLRRQVELQRQIDKALPKLFPVESPSSKHLAQLRSSLSARLATVPFDSVESRPTRRHLLAGVAAAAATCAVLAWWWEDDHASPPFFEPTPVARLYREAVRNGFEPYYECREADRFAATFLRRQGRPLQLLPLPAGSRMLGLSYPGGLSRDTTAMLCSVDDKPVMVFVDRVEADESIARHNQDPAIHVFRETRDGLVFYEVTPFPEPRMTSYLATAR